ncbi:MAG: TonB-dependent receptor [Terracidiphilus sp.]|nr:TonB-dependent receptor [Terracidiphilus sp.]
MNRIRLGILCLVLLTLGMCSGRVSLYAQTTTEGAIAGTVVDTAGAAIPGAAVTLHDNGTNAEIKLVSDSAGYFKAALVPPGIYTVKVSAPGFGVYTANLVPVTVGSLTSVNPSLKLGTVAESVEVNAVASVMKLESADVSATLTTQEIVDLPLNGGRWSNLALLTPGAVSDSNGFGLIAFRGISPLLNNIGIDGADNNQAFFSEERGRTRAGYSTSQIAIAEFQVNTGTYTAEYGRAAGGVMNAVTKSGTNNIHGQAYFQDRDNGWGALNPFTTLTSITANTAGGSPTIVTGQPFAPKDWRKRWGFGAGGPLIKDKLFWFYAYDQYKRNFPGLAKPATPSSFFNQWADMSLGNNTCAPVSNTPSGSTVTTVNATFTAATGTTPSAGDTNACALALRVYNGNYALGAAHYNQLLYGNAVSGVTGLTGPGLLDDLGTTPRTGDEVLNTPKLDWQISQKQHASFLFHRLRWDSPGGVQTQTSNNYSRDAFGTDYVKLDYGLFKLDSLFSANLSNEFRFQYGRELDWEGQQPHTAFTDAYLNNTSGTPIQLSIYGGSSNYGFTGGMPYYSFRTAYPAETKTQFSDTANWTHKGQNVKFGFDYLFNKDLVNNLYESNGVYTYQYFSNFFADILKPAGTCDSGYTQTGLTTNGASYPCYYGYTQGFGTPKFEIGTHDYGVFVQDDWKLTPRLTLNLGVRYDYEHVPPPFPSLIASEVTPYAATSNHPADKNNFGPRVGLSWDIFGNAKTVLHAGFGTYYGRIINATILNAYEATGSPQGQFTIPSLYGASAGVAGPNAKGPRFPQIINQATSFPTPSIDYFDKNFQNPQIHQFDLSVQRELMRNTTLSVYYQGAVGRELPNFLNLNLNPATVANATNTAQSTMYEQTLTVVAGADGTCGPIACGTKITNNVYAKTATLTTGAKTVVPTYVDNHYGSVTKVVSNINSSYHGMYVDLQNRGSKYAQFDINYTWSHALDYAQNQSTSPSANSWYDPWTNPKANYGNSAFNVPNRFVAWAMLNYPGNAKGLLRYVTNGWHANPMIQIQNGLPYTAGISGTMPTATYGSGTSAYTYTAAGSGMNGSANSSYLLQLGRNTYKQPNTYVVDLRLQKDLQVSERFKIELVGEAFNLANHQNVTGVNSTVYSIYSSGSTVNGAKLAANSLVFQNPGTGKGVNASGFGTVSNADSNFVYSQRQIQLGFKMDF